MGDKGGELSGHPYGGVEVKGSLDSRVTKEANGRFMAFSFQLQLGDRKLKHLWRNYYKSCMLFTW